jgi:hypothetical protein
MTLKKKEDEVERGINRLHSLCGIGCGPVTRLRVVECYCMIQKYLTFIPHLVDVWRCCNLQRTYCFHYFASKLIILGILRAQTGYSEQLMQENVLEVRCT